MLSRYRKPEPAWMEPARIASTVIWVFALTLYTFYQNCWLYAGWGQDAFSRIGIMTGISTLQWYASYFHSLALAMALYLASHLFRRREETILTIGLRRSGRTQILATLCLGLCAYLIYVRIAPFLPLMIYGAEQRPPVLSEFLYGEDKGWQYFNQFEAFTWIGLVIALTVLVRGWG